MLNTPKQHAIALIQLRHEQIRIDLINLDAAITVAFEDSTYSDDKYRALIDAYLALDDEFQRTSAAVGVMN